MNTYFPAEWYPQSFIQLTWPHCGTDWVPYLSEADACFAAIAREIALRQNLLIVCNSSQRVMNLIDKSVHNNIICVELKSDDTWARDHGGVTVLKNNKATIIDYKFNGWGDKFGWENDNEITKRMFEKQVVVANELQNANDFILEGGSIESNGQGIVLTTENCLLNPNRNAKLNKVDVENKLKQQLGAHTILWLKNGYLVGDDTDSHIDTLARFVDENTIMYVSCTNVDDEHYIELLAMEKELKAFRNLKNEPFKLIPLPMSEPIFDEGERLPATYANFLIMNNAVLVPTYNCRTDKNALEVIKLFYSHKEVIGIDCSILVKQHGSLHCVTMQYPMQVLLNKNL